MLARIAATVAVTVSAVVFPTPAQALDGYAVNSCAAVSTDEVRGRCTMITTPGVYTLELYSQSRYAWARVQCAATGTTDLLWVDLWNTDPDYPHATDTAYLPGPQCMLIVAAGNDGTAAAYVHL